MDVSRKLVSLIEADISTQRLILPTLPEVAMEVRRTVERPDASFTELAAAISRDPGLSGRLMKVANSAMMRGNRPIEDIKGAIQRLGLRLVRSLVNSLAIIQTFSHGGHGFNQRLRGILDHSTEVAALSYALAAHATRLNPEQAMLAGLVHDIGKLPILRRAWETRELRNHMDQIRGVCGEMHAHVGALVLESWSFPDELVAVAREHENVLRDTGTPADYTDVVIAANFLSYEAQADNPYAGVAYDRVPALMKLGLAQSADRGAIEERYDFAIQMLKG